MAGLALHKLILYTFTTAALSCLVIAASLSGRAADPIEIYKADDCDSASLHFYATGVTRTVRLLAGGARTINCWIGLVSRRGLLLRVDEAPFLTINPDYTNTMRISSNVASHSYTYYGFDRTVDSAHHYYPEGFAVLSVEAYVEDGPESGENNQSLLTFSFEAAEAYDLCNDDVVELPHSALVKTPLFPQRYVTTKECNTTIVARGGATIRLAVLEVVHSPRASGSGCPCFYWPPEQNSSCYNHSAVLNRELSAIRVYIPTEKERAHLHECSALLYVTVIPSTGDSPSYLLNGVWDFRPGTTLSASSTLLALLSIV